MSLIIFSHRTGRILNLSPSAVHQVHNADRNTNCHDFQALKDSDGELYSCGMSESESKGRSAYSSSQPHRDNGEKEKLNAATPAAITPSALIVPRFQRRANTLTEQISCVFHMTFKCLLNCLGPSRAINWFLRACRYIHGPNRREGTDMTDGRQWIPIQIRHVLIVPPSVPLFVCGGGKKSPQHRESRRESFLDRNTVV